jgi:hypothetical protein
MNQYCSPCKSTLRQMNQETQYHHASPEKLLEAVRMGCIICSTMVYKCREIHKQLIVRNNREATEPVALVDAMPIEDILKNPLWHNFAVTSCIDYKYFWLSARTPEIARRNMLCEWRFSLFPYQKVSTPPNFQVSEGRTSTKQVDLRPWLSDCLQSHQCWLGLEDGRTNYVPPRLIDCTGQTLRLRESSQL